MNNSDRSNNSDKKQDILEEVNLHTITIDNLGNFDHDTLKGICRKMGFRVQGSKEELINRIMKTRKMYLEARLSDKKGKKKSSDKEKKKKKNKNKDKNKRNKKRKRYIEGMDNSDMTDIDETEIKNSDREFDDANFATHTHSFQLPDEIRSLLPLDAYLNIW